VVKRAWINLETAEVVEIEEGAVPVGGTKAEGLTMAPLDRLLPWQAVRLVPVLAARQKQIEEEAKRAFEQINRNFKQVSRSLEKIARERRSR